MLLNRSQPLFPACFWLFISYTREVSIIFEVGLYIQVVLISTQEISSLLEALLDCSLDLLLAVRHHKSRAEGEIEYIESSGDCFKEEAVSFL